ncbi:MAG TPA: DUF5131 family protein [Verrucomicrobiae bacterium]|jgi:protein gp37|nr:DUF5131 family protein [Verrucomicrobiae bacterium]
MGKETNIQWCDSSVNPTGFQCDGCELWQPKAKVPVKKCYAGRWAERVGGIGAFDKPIELKPGRMAEAAKWKDLRGVERKDKPWIPAAMPRLVFIGDMADTFSTGVPFEYLKKEVVDVVRGWPHIGLWLTKRPNVMKQFSRWIFEQFGAEWPKNLWVGTSVTSPDKIHRIDQLYEVGDDSTKRFISFEPLLGETDFAELKRKLRNWQMAKLFDWAIIGGDSDPKPEAFDMIGAADLINILTEGGIEVFVKQFGKLPVCGNANVFDWHDEEMLAAYGEGFASVRLMTRDPKGGDWSEWPKQFQRREFPKP